MKRPFRSPDEERSLNRKRMWRWRLRRVHGLEEQEFDDMVRRQAGECAIESCHNIVIDHDHETGWVRGLLCYSCNTILGLAEDNPTILREAARYIEFHRKKNSRSHKPLPLLPRPKKTPEELEWRRQLMLGNTRGFQKGQAAWNKGQAPSPEQIAKKKKK